MLKFDIEKIKTKLEEQKQKLDSGKRKEKDIHADPIVKVEKAGEYYFRAFPYIHNQDYLSDPFPDRFYHFGIPGVGTVYCPQKNSGGKEKCAICDFVWEQMKAYKGIKEQTSMWQKFLPKRRLLIPGILRGRENEGIKFFNLSTKDSEPGDEHKNLNKWLTGAKTFDFLDPANGFDLILEYEAYDESKSAALNGAKFGFKGLQLDRDRTPISDDVAATWEKIEESLKNVDVDIPGFEKKTYKDTEEVLNRWMSALEKKAKKTIKPVVNEAKDTNGTSVSKEIEEPADTSLDVQVDEDDKPVTAASVAPAEIVETPTNSVEDRKSHIKRLLKKT